LKAKFITPAYIFFKYAYCLPTPSGFAGGWTATVPDPKNPGQTIPNPLSEQAEFQRAITQYLRDNYRTFKISTAEKAAKATAEAAADADLPPQGN
jgi:hypothetical protein